MASAMAIGFPVGCQIIPIAQRVRLEPMVSLSAFPSMMRLVSAHLVEWEAHTELSCWELDLFASSLQEAPA
jgi:hypothetical protein